MTSSLSILVAEDDESDVLFLKRAFKQAELLNPVHVASDGQEAIDFLLHARAEPNGKLPGLVILDLKMPRRDGLQVLEWMRAQPVIKSIPVVIFSSSSNRSDIESAYDLGANAFLTKPPTTGERTELARFIRDWLKYVQPPLAAAESISAAESQRVPS